eukprot:5621061-Pyramimonas_sp.AAC.1
MSPSPHRWEMNIAYCTLYTGWNVRKWIEPANSAHRTFERSLTAPQSPSPQGVTSSPPVTNRMP